MLGTTLPLSTVVPHLARTPTELVLSILDDLRVWDVLRLICHKNPRLNHCIMAHPWYASIFSNARHITELETLAAVYWDVCYELHWARAPLGSILALSTSQAAAGGFQSDDIIHYLLSRMFAQLHRPLLWQREILRLPSPTSPYSTDYLGDHMQIRARWDEIQEIRVRTGPVTWATQYTQCERPQRGYQGHMCFEPPGIMAQVTFDTFISQSRHFIKAFNLF